MSRDGGILLEVDLTAPMAEGSTSPLQRALSARHPSVAQVVDRLHEAAQDDRVVGLVAQTGTTPLSLAAHQELHHAVRAFVRSGKPSVAWAESFGELTPSVPGYYLASAFDSVWLQPSGQVGLHGLTLAVPFVRTLLDRLGIEPDLRQREEFKNAPDSVMRSEISEAHETALRELLRSISAVLMGAVANARGFPPARVEELMAEAPLGGARAREVGLVDHLGYRHHVYTAVREQLVASGTRGHRRLVLPRYRAHRPQATLRAANARVRPTGQTVALLSMSGMVQPGHQHGGPLATGIASATTSATLSRLAQDEHVGALVVRVDSPGGSYVASDAIWEAVRHFRASGRPVVASMGSVAASGGYYVSMAADRIVATPATITGSIGVYAGKLVVEGLLDRLGIHVEDVAVGGRARMPSARHRYSEEEAAALEAWLDEVYADFVAKVATSRHLNEAAVAAVAKGRVWTGEQALQRGLVDHLGGLRTAVRLAQRLAGLPTTAPLRDVSPSPWRQLRGPRTSDDAGSSVLDWYRRGWGEHAEAALSQRLGITGPLTCPFVPTVR
jgi:protease-4